MKLVFRPHLLAVAISGIRIWGKDESFLELLDKHPEFAKEWSLEMMTAVTHTVTKYEDTLFVEQIPKCEKCNKRIELGVGASGVDVVGWFCTKKQALYYK